MQRREFVARVLPGAILGTAAGCVGETTEPAASETPRITWRLASSFSRSVDTIYGGAETLAERVGALTDGRFQIRPYPGGELVPALQVLDAVQQGTVQIGHTCSYYYTGKHPALAFDTCVPFGLTARQQYAWLTEAGGMELLDEVFADFNVMSLPGGNTGIQMGGWFKEPIGSTTDLKGLKIRIPGLGGQVMSKLGATVQVLAGGDIFPALERGAIDATEWVGPYDDEKLGFHKVAKHYYYPGWWEPGPTINFYVNRDEWAKLPATYQAAIRTATVEAGAKMQAQYDARNAAALRRLVEGGVTIHRYSDEILDAAAEATEGLHEEYAAKNAAYRKIYDQWKGFREASYRWFGTAELAYAEYAFRR
jgi:TRAP-type mannitol/chloroaromatic compound transport system substrate-binding protein